MFILLSNSIILRSSLSVSHLARLNEWASVCGELSAAGPKSFDLSLQLTQTDALTAWIVL